MKQSNGMWPSNVSQIGFYAYNILTFEYASQLGFSWKCMSCDYLMHVIYFDIYISNILGQMSLADFFFSFLGNLWKTIIKICKTARLH